MHFLRHSVPVSGCRMALIDSMLYLYILFYTMHTVEICVLSRELLAVGKTKRLLG